MIKLIAALMLATTPFNPVVDAPSGTIEGLIENDVKIYRGIPYAKPPVGAIP